MVDADAARASTAASGTPAAVATEVMYLSVSNLSIGMSNLELKTTRYLRLPPG